MLIQTHGLKLLTVTYHLTIFSVFLSSGDGDKTYLRCHVSPLYVTIVPYLLAIGIAIEEI